ncbi:MAG: Crp/Fnr family transcriptional regulator [Bradyrhizobium sp.]
MTTISNPPNYFLSPLSSQVFAPLERHIAIVDLPEGTVLYRNNEKIQHVYFPVSGIISFVVRLADGQLVDSGSAGYNGAAGLTALHDEATAINDAIVRVAMKAATINAHIMKALVADSKPLCLSCIRHERMMLVLAQRIAACNAIHRLDQRLVRCLLQAHDLLDDNAVPVSPEALSQMLGVSRSQVALALRMLRRAGLIDYRLGQIQLIDIGGLWDAACECYDAINAQFYRIIVWNPDRH